MLGRVVVKVDVGVGFGNEGSGTLASVYTVTDRLFEKLHFFPCLLSMN